MRGKIRNTRKNRLATPNEVAKSIIIDKLEACDYITDDDSWGKAYDDEFLNEVFRFLDMHRIAIRKKFNCIDRDVDSSPEYPPYS